MVRAYERTMMKADLSKALVEIWDKDSDEQKPMITFKGIKSWSIIDGEDAKEYGDNSEYLVINTKYGKSIFENDKVSMFLW
jgi:hypothetical protein